MKHHVERLAIVIISILTLVACGGQSLPTLTPQPSGTPVPTNTFTPLPTAALVTFTPTPTPRIISTERHKVRTEAQEYKGGYSFLVPIHLVTTLSDTQTTFHNTNSTISISFTTIPRKDNAQTMEIVLNDFLTNIKKDVQDLDSGVPYTEKISDMDSVAVDVTETHLNVRNSGKLIVTDTGQKEFFIAFAFVVDGVDGRLWDSEGTQAFDALINSVQFFHD